jgi:hypothetical protein
MGIFYLGLFIGYLLVSILTIWLVKKFFKRRWLTWATVAFAVLFPTYDIIIQGALLAYYGNTRTLQEIRRTVDAPSSVYWEDNVWPGYDENYRLWMIDHLLDGEHLHTLAMNGPDGKIYLYRHGKGDLPEVFGTVGDLPQFNYQVKLDPVPLWFWEKPFIWGDRVEITDNRGKELIAYSERFMGYSPRMFVIRALGQSYPFERGGHVGDKSTYNFDDKVLFTKISENLVHEIFRNNFRDRVRQ